MSTTLYDKYGGFTTITAVVHNFYDKIGQSKSLEPFFIDADMEKLMDHQTKFICMALGGPNNYNGKSMEIAHKKLKITNEAFTEVAGYLQDALEEAGMEDGDVKTVITLVGSMSNQIITA
ncbi:MAG: group 1 truncated hemoglobin [Bdellovibrionota bacterium]